MSFPVLEVGHLGSRTNFGSLRSDFSIFEIILCKKGIFEKNSWSNLVTFPFWEGSDPGPHESLPPLLGEILATSLTELNNYH